MVFQNNVLSGAAGSGTTAYEIDQSIRFNPADSAYMSRTPSGSSSSRKKWTFSGWFKRGNITPSSSSRFFNVHSDSNNFFISQFQSDDSFNVTAREGGSEVLKFEPARRFRDPSAWYHVVMAFDSTNSIGSERFRVYFNGVRDTTALETTPSADLELVVLENCLHQIGRDTYSGSTFLFDGYMADLVLLDGTSTDCSSFGEFNSSGIWIPKSVSGLTFGTNGFYIDGRDSSDLGDDESGQGNDFTTSGLAAHDQMADSPTNNHATWSPITGSAQVYSNGNLNAATASSAWKGGFTTIQVPLNSGTWYYEMYIDSAGSSSGQLSIGWSESDRSVTDNNDSGDTQGWVTYALNGKTYNNAASTVSYGATYTTGDVIGCKINTDTSSNNITFYKNGASQGNLSEAFNGGTTGFISPYILLYGTRNATARFAQAEWTQTPSGITEDNAINTKNLGS